MTDDEIVSAIQQGIVNQIDGLGSERAWERLANIDLSHDMLTFMSMAVLGVLRRMLRKDVPVQAKHLRALGIGDPVISSGIPDHAKLRKCVSLGMPRIGMIFWPWDSN